MAKRESGLRKHLKTLLEGAGFFFQGIESGETGDGIPDAYFCSVCDELKGWLELKRVRESIGDSPVVTVPYRPGQFSWLSRHWQNGGLSLLCIEFDKGFVIFRNRGIKKTYSATELLSEYTDSLTLNYFILKAKGEGGDRQKST